MYVYIFSWWLDIPLTVILKRVCPNHWPSGHPSFIEIVDRNVKILGYLQILACALIIFKQYQKCIKYQILRISIGKIPLGFWSANGRMTEAEAKRNIKKK